MTATLQSAPIGGRYELGPELATIRTTVIHQALDQKTGHPIMVGINRIFEDESAPGDIRRQVRHIAQRLAGLRHRNLPRVIDLVEEGPCTYTVMEEFRGKPMDSLPVPMDAQVVHRYAEQILQVLQYLHTQEPCIVHRDLRPGCILVSTHGTVQLLGSALARVVHSSIAKTLFRGGGSPEFAAPGQLAGAASQPTHDLYSAGAVFYYLLTGKPPTPGLQRLRSGEALEPLPASVPADLARLTMSLLEVEPENRPVSAAAALEQLCAGDVRGRTSQPELTTSVPAPTPGPATPAPAPASTATSEPKKSMWSLLFGGSAGPKKETPRSPDSHLPEETVTPPPGTDVFLELSEMDLNHEVAQLLPETAARSIQGVCIAVSESGEMTLAVKDPSLVYIYDHVAYATHNQYRATLRGADATQIELALEWVYKSRSKAPWRTWVERRALDKVHLVVANQMADSSSLTEEISHPVIEATERILKEALAVGTSDIHMEAFENRLEVRYRIDGVLQPAATYPPETGSAMVKRIKVMANMDVAQERITQGGRISLALGDQKYDMRVSVVPVANGESVVMRVLKKGSFNLTLADLGIDPPVEKRFRNALSQPHGIILVCGPTGSGKSTTLYASLKELMRPDRKLLTVEDPVEYEMDGLVQVQVNMAPKDEDQKVTFAKVLREFLRQDPEVILVGEIRDQETAQIALQASLTGHLVLSTLHTNDSVGLVSRLRDMGCKSFLVASTLRCGLSQRLARRICEKCRVEIPLTPEIRDVLLQEQIPQPHRHFHGQGCRECRFSGYKGRIGIYEVLEVNPTVRSLIAREAPDEQLLASLQADGFRTLRQNGLEKVVEGSITFDEVQRVCEGGH